MTNKMKLIFVTVTIFSALFFVLCTHFAIDITDRVLPAIANALSPHESLVSPTLALLIIPALYLTFRQRRHP